MALVINTNVASLSAQKSLMGTERALARNVARLSSGLRITEAADDASGLAISERLKAQMRGLQQASRNSNDGISMIQIAEGAMNEQATILTRLRELAVQSANGTLTATERSFITTEKSQLMSEITRIAQVTEFNGTFMLNTGGATTSMQIGMKGTANDRISVTFSATTVTGLSLSTVTMGTSTTAQSAIGLIDSAINTLSTRRANLGAVQNRLVVTVNNLATSFEQFSAANSRIRDVDVAEETSSFTRNQILQQSGTAMLAQANTLPQAALSLIR